MRRLFKITLQRTFLHYVYRYWWACIDYCVYMVAKQKRLYCQTMKKMIKSYEHLISYQMLMEQAKEKQRRRKSKGQNKRASQKIIKSM